LNTSVSNRWKNIIRLTLRYIFLIILLVIIMAPLLWVFLGSVKPENEILTTPTRWLPSEWLWHNYIDVWKAEDVGALKQNFPLAFLNSFIMTGSIVLGRLLFSAMAGYGFAKFKWPGQQIAFFFVLATMMLPLEVTMIPLFIITKSFGWIGTYQGIIIPIMINATAVFFMRQSLLSIPNELIDAARIDGCTELGIFFRIIIPLSKSALAGLGILIGLETWNNFLWPLLVAPQQNMHTATVALQMLVGNWWAPNNHILAMCLVLSLPPLLAFILLQKQLVESGVLSGLK
jgi:multiple sugar transport system permease protein